jgi:hypothetical protein
MTDFDAWLARAYAELDRDERNYQAWRRWLAYLGAIIRRARRDRTR